MKVLVYHGPGKRSWEEKPKPIIIEPTDAVVKISKTTICGTDLHILKGDVPVETVLSVKSDRMEAYTEALRRNVCGQCKHQIPDGTCALRANLECCLDRYFPLIAEAIEKVSAMEYGACHVN